MKEAHFGLSGNALKIIAMISMLFDHIGFYLFPHIAVLRWIGRLAFPIFAYMIAEGCTYTKNRKRYFLLIAALGVLCQVVVTVATGIRHMNILITFTLSLATIFAIEALLKNRTPRNCVLSVLTLAFVVFVTVAMPRMFTGFVIDYDEFGVILPVLVYFARGKWQKLLATTVVLIAFALVSASRQWFSLLALPLLALYSGKRGRARLKYLFYVFYPTHQAILWLIAEFLLD